MTLAQQNDLEKFTSDQETAQALSDINVNISTGFATNYLNHYVEILLLLEMLPSMPEGVDDIKQWQPINYSDHVKQSGLPNHHLVLEAFNHTDWKRREALEKASNTADVAILHYAKKAINAASNGDTDLIQTIAEEAKVVLTPILEKISGVINAPSSYDNEQVEEFA